MAHPLNSALHKYNRAQFHLGDLRSAVRGQRESIRIDLDLKPGTPHYRLRLQNGPDVDEAILAILGDCIHNFRACLDHLMNGLAVMNGRKRGKRVFFPVLTTPGWDGKDKSDARHALSTIKVPAQGVIKAAQPHHGWNGPDPHPIAELHDLDITDKHRDFATTVVMPVGAEFSIVNQVDCQVEELMPLGLGRRLEPGADLGQLRVGFTGPNPKIGVEAVFTPTIEFEDGREIVGVMERIGDYIFRAILTPLMPGATLEVVMEGDDDVA
jgi:hypothetical protein